MNTQTLERPSRGIQRLAAIQTEAERVLRSLPSLSDEELLEARKVASTIGRCAWLIEYAIDAELLQRLGEKRGRGNKDTNERGLTALAKERAGELGIHHSQVWRHVQVINTFFPEILVKPENILADQSSILEPTYYELALRSTDPHATIKEFKRAKASDPNFSTREARKAVQTQSAPDLSSVVECALDNPEARAAWEAFKRACRGLGAHVPIVRGILNGYVEELEYELSLPAKPLRERILAKIAEADEGGVSVEDLAQLTGYHRDICAVFLQRLKADGHLVEKFRKSEYSKTADKRGTRLYALAA